MTGLHTMNDRARALQSLAVGDVFHGHCPKSGASLICLVTSVSDNRIDARRITTQDDLQFDRRTGLEVGNVSAIDCVVPFPPDIYDIFLEMDRKYRELYEMVRDGVEFDWERCKLTPDEKRALLFIDGHIEANPI
jgi:hypothetical protein